MPDNQLCYRSLSKVLYPEFMNGHYRDLKSVRRTKGWEVFSAWLDEIPLLFLVEHDIRQVVQFEYASLEKQERDIVLWRHLPPGGDEEAGTPAFLLPLLPTLSASDAQPFPPDSTEKSE